MAGESTRREQEGEVLALVGEGVGAVAGVVEEMHRAIAARSFDAMGLPALPVRAVHDAITGGTYAAVAALGRVIGAATGAAVALRPGATPRPLSDEPWAREALGAINGLHGDWLEARGSPLAITMGLRLDGADLEATPAALRGAHPAATGHLAVFVHGLCGTEDAWRRDALRLHGDAASTHGTRLGAALGLTPVYVRYNTGRRISANGAELSALLSAVVSGWPVPVERLTLIGHSMGGLVIRSATAHARADSSAWVEKLHRAVYLGSPHLGAPLERNAHRLAWLLRQIPETRAISTVLRSRSAGIRDLAHGSTTEADWRGRDPEAWLDEPDSIAPLDPAVRHHFIGCTLADSHQTVAGRLLGDLLVPFESASGKGRRRQLAFEVEAGKHLGRLGHLDLLNHPRVYAELQAWLSS